MGKIPVQKIARVLYVLVLAALACNVIALLEVPFFVWSGNRIPDVMRVYTDDALLVGEDHMVLAFLMGGVVSWKEGWWGFFDIYQTVLTCFLLFSGCCTAVILWQGRRVLDTVLKGNPFVMDNAKSLKTAAMCCFLISGAALVRLVWGFTYYQSIAPLLTYNALFVPIFLMGGLLFMVMSALFRQAAGIKAENDLTI